MIREFLQRMRNKKSKFKDAQEEFRISKMIGEREKTANERELERFMEEERQKNITAQLKMFRKKRQQEIAEMKILSGKNIFKNQNNILKQPNIFSNDKNLFFQRGGIV